MSMCFNLKNNIINPAKMELIVISTHPGTSKYLEALSENEINYTECTPDNIIRSNKDINLILLELKPNNKVFKETIKKLQNFYPKSPILFVSEEISPKIYLDMYELGIDDIVLESIDLEILPIKLKMMVRRFSKVKDSNNTRIQIADLVLDPNTMEVYRAGQKISLRYKEFKLLEYMMRNKNIVLTRDAILNDVWDYSSAIFTNTVDVHVTTLRNKVDKPFKPNLICTVHGAGYKLSDGTELL